MQENLSELAKKYHEEMLRMYGRRKPELSTSELRSVEHEPAAEQSPVLSTIKPRSVEHEPAAEQSPVLSTIKPGSVEHEPAAEQSSVLSTIKPRSVEHEPAAEQEPVGKSPVSPDLSTSKPDAVEDQPLSPSLAPVPPDADDFQYDAAEDAATLPEEGALPSYIQPVGPQLPEEWAAQEAYENRNTAEGYLRVIAAAADSAYPVPDARVTVFTYIGKKLHLSYLLQTDENGETPTVPLPAPPADLSQEPENATPFASCDIRIAAKGFFKTQARDVHIFAGVTTRQEFQLVPLPITSEPGDEDIDPNEIGRTEECQGGAPC